MLFSGSRCKASCSNAIRRCPGCGSVRCPARATYPASGRCRIARIRRCVARSRERRAVLFFSCYDFTLASQSMSLAVQIVDRLTTSAATAEHLGKMLESCREMVGQVGFDPTTVGMVQAAVRRGIPWVRLSPVGAPCSTRTWVSSATLREHHAQQRIGLGALLCERQERGAEHSLADQIARRTFRRRQGYRRCAEKSGRDRLSPGAQARRRQKRRLRSRRLAQRRGAERSACRRACS